MDKWTGPKAEPKRITGNLSKLSRYIMIVVAILLLISPDPFTDVLAFGLLGKAGISISFRTLAKGIKADSCIRSSDAA